MAPATVNHGNHHHGRLSHSIPPSQEPASEGGRVHGVLCLRSGATVDELMGTGPTWANNRNESHDSTSLPKLLLALTVHHSVWVTSVCLVFPDQTFHGLALLDKHELLDDLKREHLTLDPTKQVPLTTGVPPHIDHMIALKKVFDLCTKIDLKLDSHAINQKFEAEGGVTCVNLAKSLDQLKDELFFFGSVLSVSVVGHHPRMEPPYITCCRE